MKFLPLFIAMIVPLCGSIFAQGSEDVSCLVIEMPPDSLGQSEFKFVVTKPGNDSQVSTCSITSSELDFSPLIDLPINSSQLLRKDCCYEFNLGSFPTALDYSVRIVFKGSDGSIVGSGEFNKTE